MYFYKTTIKKFRKYKGHAGSAFDRTSPSHNWKDKRYCLAQPHLELLAQLVTKFRGDFLVVPWTIQSVHALTHNPHHLEWALAVHVVHAQTKEDAVYIASNIPMPEFEEDEVKRPRRKKSDKEVENDDK